MPRKSVHKPDKNAANSLLLSLVFFVSIAEPVATLPQIYTIWVYKQTAGVSLLSWCLYLFAAGVWLTYGFNRNDRALIVSSFAWVITEVLVVIGILLFR
jgi:uncharacterized protein with PQ loop repeat